MILQYAKVHTCDFADEACLESGDTFSVCDFHGVRLGVMICYDREYPESARLLMLKGAEIILVPNDCAAMAPRLNTLSTTYFPLWILFISVPVVMGLSAIRDCQNIYYVTKYELLGKPLPDYAAEKEVMD